MNEPADEIYFRRVLVPLRTKAAGDVLLPWAADLALSFGIILTGLYVEDADVLALSDLPLAREVAMADARIVELSRDRVARYFEKEAALLCRALYDIAANRRIEHDFLLRRGRLILEIGSQSEEHDIVVAETTGDVLVQGRAGLAASPSRALLVVPREFGAAAGPVTTFFAGTMQGIRAVRLAARIAATLRRKLRIVAAPADRGAADMEARILAAGLLPAAAREAIAEALRQPRAPGGGKPERPSLVVVADEALAQDPRYWYTAGVPLFIVKNHEAR